MAKKSAILYVTSITAAVVILGFLYYELAVKRVLKPARKDEIVKEFPFSEENALKEWEEKIFRGKVVYSIEQDQPLSYVRANSDKAASALYYKIKLDARRANPVISWKWNVDKFPQKAAAESLETENEDDFAARVYVIFLAPFFTNSKVLEYIWAETLPEGMIGTSPYSKNIKLIVARSGANKDKKWFREDRDIAADYLKAFGMRPEYDIGAVAFMTNAEHTGTSADAMYDEIKLGYKE
jgi:hypothetical protein